MAKIIYGSVNPDRRVIRLQGGLFLRATRWDRSIRLRIIPVGRLGNGITKLSLWLANHSPFFQSCSAQ